VFSSIPDAVLVSGTITGEAAAMSDLEAVKRVLPTTPVLANTGVKHATLADVLAVADGCIVGSALKFGGDTWAAVDPDRAADFMARARAARGADGSHLSTNILGGRAARGADSPPQRQPKGTAHA
jgi:uncharacterized protein